MKKEGRKRKADDTEPMSQNTMNISGDNFRAKDVSQDTANTMDKRQITNINISLPSRGSSQDEKWEDEAERGNL